MNGLSDVRLTLHGPQLQAEHESFQVVSSPAGLSRWGLFFHRSRTRRASSGLKPTSSNCCASSLSKARRVRER